MPAPSEVYSRHLLAKGNGFPLWTPEPNESLSDEHRNKGIMIGDVGIIKADGSFDFLFNICVPSSHAVNHRNGVPPGFENVQSGETRTVPHYHPYASTFSSDSIKETRASAGVSVPGNE
jgi:hypothetical protein